MAEKCTAIYLLLLSSKISAKPNWKKRAFQILPWQPFEHRLERHVPQNLGNQDVGGNQLLAAP